MIRNLGVSVFKKQLGIVLLVFFIKVDGFAQLTISGKVIEAETAESLPHAAVTIAGTTRGTTTNLDGYFSLFDLSGPDIELEVSYVGYETRHINLSKEDLADDLLIVKLNPKNS